MIKKFFVLLTAFFIGAQAAAFAAINVETRTGTLKITMPDGTVQEVAATDPLPVIPDGAVIEVLSGIISVTVTGNDSVNVLAGGQSVVVGSGSTLNVSFEPTGAAIFECAQGEVSVLAADGSIIQMNAGDQIRMAAGSAPEVLRGEVSFTNADGETTDLSADQQAETYIAPEVPDTGDIDTTIQGEETAGDISPVAP